MNNSGDGSGKASGQEWGEGDGAGMASAWGLGSGNELDGYGGGNASGQEMDLDRGFVSGQGFRIRVGMYTCKRNASGWASGGGRNGFGLGSANGAGWGDGDGSGIDDA